MLHTLVGEAFAATEGRPEELDSPGRAALVVAVMFLVLAPLVVVLVLLSAADGSAAPVDPADGCATSGYPATINGWQR